MVYLENSKVRVLEQRVHSGRAEQRREDRGQPGVKRGADQIVGHCPSSIRPLLYCE